MQIIDKSKKALNPYRVVVLAYAITIIIGMFLLSLPISHVDGKWYFNMDTLFLATNALSVTGLDPIHGGIGKFLSHFGLIITLTLSQLGGLGIMTISSFIVILIGRRLSANEESFASKDIGESHGEIIKNLIIKAIKFTFICEGFGAFILANLFYFGDYGLSLDNSVFHGVFFSVMAFCNSGISLYNNSIANYINSPAIQLMIIFLATTGGIGFIVISELTSKSLFNKKRMKRGRLSLHSKLTIITTLSIVLSVATIILLIEYNGNAFKEAGVTTWHQKLLSSLLHVSQSRNAGFSTITTSTLTDATLILTMCVMFIGAAAGSTGGGIKVTTIAIIFATIRAQIANRKETVIFDRTINATTVRDAFIICYLYLASFILGTFCLSLTEQYNAAHQLKDVMFEVLSALTTTGLSTGITPDLTVWSKLCIVVCMFVGRLGPITIVMLLGKRNQQYLTRFPEENISVG